MYLDGVGPNSSIDCFGFVTVQMTFNGAMPREREASDRVITCYICYMNGDKDGLLLAINDYVYYWGLMVSNHILSVCSWIIHCLFMV